MGLWGSQQAGGGGDMLKATYDANNDGKADKVGPPAIANVTYVPNGTTTIGLSSGAEIFKATAATGPTTWAVTGMPAAGFGTGFVLDLTNGGSQTQTMPAGTKYSKGLAPTLTVSGKDRLIFDHDGTNWTVTALTDIK